MSKLIGKCYPLDVVIDMDEVQEIKPSDTRGIIIWFKNRSYKKVDSIVSM